MDAVEQGLLVIADIGGYTRYVSGVELDHSHDILADLIGVVADRLGGSLRVVKLEGDAVFCCGGDESLLDDLQECYSAFARRQRRIALNTSCRCDACRRISDLDLKFVAHHGSFVEHEVAGREELVGADVIMVHRMLKNSVTEQFGLRGYALLSDACLISIGIDQAGLHRHSERYEDIGEVAGVVIDLEEPWRAAAPVRLADGDADIVLTADVAASAARVWDAQTDAAKQLGWRVGATRVEPDGDPGIGTKTHCVHGNTTITQEIVDWQPERYYSYTERNPIGSCLWTIELESLAEGVTHVVWRIALTGGRTQRVLYAVIGGRVRRMLKANIDALAAFVEAPRADTAEGARASAR
jgi:uncharacterized protein YndB with AHSA1/START domain